MNQKRRQFLTILGTTGVAAFAGCSNSTGTESPSGDSETPSNSSETPTPSDGSEAVTPPAEQSAKLTPVDGDADDRFGWRVAMSADGTTALASAWADEDPNGAFAGSAYVFEQSGDGWRQQAKISADDGDSLDRFGWSLAMSSAGTTAVIGAPYDEDPNGPEAGSVHVFEADSGSWRQQAKLVADDGSGGDHFGDAVAVSNAGAVMIGAPGDDEPNGEDSGSVYVFGRSGGDWTQQSKLTPDDGDEGDEFGMSLALADTTAVVGAPEDENGGSAYVFEASGDNWTQQNKLTPPDDSGGRFGTAVGTSSKGAMAIVGAPEDEGSGTAHVFQAADSDWNHQTAVTPEDGSSGDFFGSSMAVADTGTIGLLGAPGVGGDGGSGAGAAYVFQNADDGWSQQTRLTADDRDSEDYFADGVAVAGDGTVALVGAFGDENSNGASAGSAYVFR